MIRESRLKQILLRKQIEAIKPDDIIVIGCIHLGVKDKADDFYNPYLDKEKYLVDLFTGGNAVIVNGDFVDLWENKLKEIKKKYKRVFDSINDNVMFIEGNHDAGFSDIKILRVGNYVFLHGHQFDVYNSKWWYIGKLVTKLCASLERSGLVNVDFVWNAFGRGRYGSTVKYFERVEKWVDDHPEYRDLTIVFCHTHDMLQYPAQLRNCGVMNCGTWAGKIDILTIPRKNMKEKP